MAEINDLLVAQFFRTTVAITAPIGQALIVVADSSGFPVPTGNGYFYLTIVVGDVANVYTIVGNDTGSNTLEVSEILQETISVGSRAEHWFTAQAFGDIQAFLEAIDTAIVIPPDGNTIVNTGGTLSVGLIDGTYLNLNKSILAGHLADESVTADALGLLAVSNIHVNSGIDANKIATLGESVPGAGDGSKLPLGTIPQITFAQIDYDTFTPPGSPEGGNPGDIFIEWEDFVG